jgi:hypothetical protein
MAKQSDAAAQVKAPPKERTGAAGWSTIFATWTAVLGAGWGGVQWLAKYDEEIKRSEDSHVVQTFSLYDTFNRAEMLRIRERIEAIADAQETAAAEPAAASASLTAAPAAPAPGPSPQPDRSQLPQPDLYVYVDFFDAVQVCVERALCNADLVDRLLKPYAEFDLLKERIEQVRESEKDQKLRHVFGEGIEWIDATDLQACAKARETDAEAQCTTRQVEPSS